MVQFVYGDDGLDPANLEGDGKPVDFQRTWKHARVCSFTFTRLSEDALLKFSCLQAMELNVSHSGLLPFEILRLIDFEIATPYFRTACSDEFLADVRTFVLDAIARPASQYRKAYHMPAALDPLPARANRLGTSSKEEQAVVNNKTKVSEQQVRTFLQLCWIKYVKAKVEPGQSSLCFCGESIRLWCK